MLSGTQLDVKERHREVWQHVWPTPLRLSLIYIGDQKYDRKREKIGSNRIHHFKSISS